MLNNSPEQMKHYCRFGCSMNHCDCIALGKLPCAGPFSVAVCGFPYAKHCPFELHSEPGLRVRD